MTPSAVVKLTINLLTDYASGMLDAADRDAICGDLAESGVSGLPALRDVIGLVIRRRATDMRDCRTWLVLAFFGIPFGVLVSLDLRDTADTGAIYVWLYANNWSWAFTQNPGFWQEMIECAWRVTLPYIALGCWSWTAGFLIGWGSRRTLWANGSIFFGMLLVIGCFGIPHQFGHILAIGRAREYFGNAAVFANAFYRLFFPQLIEVLFVVLPAWHGMCQNAQESGMSGLHRIALLISSVVTVSALGFQSLIWWQFRFWNNSHVWIQRLPSVLPLAMLGPATYLYLIALRSKAIRDVVGRARVVGIGTPAVIDAIVQTEIQAYRRKKNHAK